LARSLVLACSLILAASLLPAPLQAQTPDPTAGESYSVVLRDVALTEALERVAALTGIDLLYGAEVAELAKERRVFCRAEDRPAEEILACVVASAELDYYRLSSGTYVVIAGPEGLPQYGSLTGVVTDGWSGQPLPQARIRIENPGATAHSNAAGIFSLTSLLPGRHQVLVSSYGYRPFRTTVEIPEQGLGRVTFALEPEPYQARPIVVDGLDPGWMAARLATRSAVEGEELLTETWGGRGLDGALPRILGVARRPFLSDVLIQGGESVTQQLRLDGVPIYNPLTVEGIVGTFSPLAMERMSVRKAGFPARYGSATAGILDLEHATRPLQRSAGQVMVDPYNLNGRLTLPLPASGGEAGAVSLTARTSLWDLHQASALDRMLRDWNQVDPLLTRALQGSEAEAGQVTPSEAVLYQDHGHGSELGSTDLHLALRMPTGPGQAIQASLYRGSSDVSTRLLAAGHHEGDPVADRLMVVEDGYDWSNLAGRVRMDGLWGDRTTTSIQLHGSRHRFASGFRMAQGPPDDADVSESEARLGEEVERLPLLTDRSAMEEVGIELSLERALGPGHRLLLGLEATDATGSLRLNGGAFPRLHTEASHTRLTGVVEDRWSRGAIALEGGLRSTWISEGDGLAHEPRAAVEVEGQAPLLGPTTARLAGGIYRQFVNQYELANPGPSALVPSVRFWLPATGDAAPPRSHHLSLEAASVPREGWELRAELFGRQTRDLPVLDYEALLAEIPAVGGMGAAGGVTRQENDGRTDMSPSLLTTPTKGSTVGIGVRVRHAGERLQTQVGYDGMRSRRTFPTRFGGEAVPDPGAAPHRALLLLHAPLGSGVSVRSRASGTWGRSWAFRRAYYDLLDVREDRPELELGRPGGQTLPALLEVDLGAGWRGSVGDWDLHLSADLLNALDRRNVLDYGLQRVRDDADQFERQPRILAGRSLALTLRVAF
jgi:hypothetical protein